MQKIMQIQGRTLQMQIQGKRLMFTLSQKIQRVFNCYAEWCGKQKQSVRTFLWVERLCWEERSEGNCKTYLVCQEVYSNYRIQSLFTTMLSSHSCISACRKHYAFWWIGYNSKRAHQIPLLSAKNRSLRLYWAQTYRNWTMECENLRRWAFSVFLKFLNQAFWYQHSCHG